MFLSVIGLNFDFLALNIVGFTLYGCYNVALFWIDSIQVIILKETHFYSFQVIRFDESEQIFKL